MDASLTFVTWNLDTRRGSVQRAAGGATQGSTEELTAPGMLVGAASCAGETRGFVAGPSLGVQAAGTTSAPDADTLLQSVASPLAAHASPRTGVSPTETAAVLLQVSGTTSAYG